MLVANHFHPPAEASVLCYDRLRSSVHDNCIRNVFCTHEIYIRIAYVIVSDDVLSAAVCQIPNPPSPCFKKKIIIIASTMRARGVPLRIYGNWGLQLKCCRRVNAIDMDHRLNGRRVRQHDDVISDRCGCIRFVAVHLAT